MTLFQNNGHLTDDALSALADGAKLDPLERLETAEHLAYCDLCLQRYTERLATVPLLAPEHSCRESVWRRIQQQTIRLLTNRYATAAAAVALALTLLWGGTRPSFTAAWARHQSGHPESTEALPDRWDTALEQVSGSLRNLFDRIPLIPDPIKGDDTP